MREAGTGCTDHPVMPSCPQLPCRCHACYAAHPRVHPATQNHSLLMPCPFQVVGFILLKGRRAKHAQEDDKHLQSSPAAQQSAKPSVAMSVCSHRPMSMPHVHGLFNIHGVCWKNILHQQCICKKDRLYWHERMCGAC